MRLRSALTFSHHSMTLSISSLVTIFSPSFESYYIVSRFIKNMPNAEDKMKAALSAAAKRQALKAKKAVAPEAKPPEPIAPEKPPIPKPESQSAPAASKKEDIFDIIKSVFTAWWVFIKKDYRAYFLELLKIHLVQIVVGLGIIILFCLIGFGAYMGVMALNLAQFWIPLAILALIFIILAYIFSSTVLQSIALSAIPMTE